MEEMRAAAAKRTVTRTSEVTLPTDRKARRGWQKATAKRYTWAGVRGSVDLGMGTSVVKNLAQVIIGAALEFVIPCHPFNR
jgi:hypothetical protein